MLAGVDGSDGSLRALRWAVEEAAIRDAVVVAAALWQRPYDYLLGADGSYVLVDEGHLVEAARETLAKAIATVAAERNFPTSGSSPSSSRGTRPRRCASKPTTPTHWSSGRAVTVPSAG